MMNKGGSPYDAKCNVAEIDAVNMGEIGTVRKRSREETGPHDSSPCVARVKMLVPLTRPATGSDGMFSLADDHIAYSRRLWNECPM